ncbi:unnamed protein product [Durusdinium trenchii]|uniref:Uncharacterized protein n=1 Tax=Durusdinium trenchii TaxID=1381693 RepID=A0ABP0JRD1_9DINO
MRRRPLCSRRQVIGSFTTSPSMEGFNSLGSGLLSSSFLILAVGWHHYGKEDLEGDRKICRAVEAAGVSTSRRQTLVVGNFDLQKEHRCPDPSSAGQLCHAG